mgnify:CR=1 FL=1
MRGSGPADDADGRPDAAPGPNVPVFLVGPRKTGTTSLYAIFRAKGLPVSHKVKESMFFDQETIDLNGYGDIFGLDLARPFIEVSPSYFTAPFALLNVVQHFPEAWIVVTLRHPVDRALSGLAHARRIGLAVTEGPDHVLNEKQLAKVADTSRYEVHVGRWVRKFPGRVLRLRQRDDGTYGSAALATLSEVVGAPITPGDVDATRANPARSARSQTLARLAHRTKRSLRRAGAHRAVTILKPLNKLLYAPSGNEDWVPSARRWLEAQLTESIAYYDAIGEAAVLDDEHAA